MSYRSVPLLSLVCCASLLAVADDARGRMTVREVPLNHTAAWGKHVAMLRESPPPAGVPPLRVAVGAASATTATPAITAPLASTATGTAQAGFATGHVPREWIARIRRASSRHGIDAALLAAVLKAESDFNPNAVSPKGARGAMQIMPSTGRALGLRNFFDPEANLDAGASYLASLLREFSRLEYALAAYNAGPDAVRRHGGLPPYEETQRYVARVLALFKRYGSLPR